MEIILRDAGGRDLWCARMGETWMDREQLLETLREQINEHYPKPRFKLYLCTQDNVKHFTVCDDIQAVLGSMGDVDVCSMIREKIERVQDTMGVR